MKMFHPNKISGGRRKGVKARRLFNLMLADAEKDEIKALIKRGKSMRPKIPYGTVSLVMREGARQFVEQQNRLLDKAEAGLLHAKPRNPINHKAAQTRK